MLCTTLAVVLFMLFDVFYFIRGYIGRLTAPLRKKYWPKHLLDEVVRPGIFTTNDLGFWWMMSPSRYMRECDFARFDMWDQNFGVDTILKLGGGIYCSGQVATYMVPLKLFDTYLLRTKIICWDEKAFYVEQRFERRQDKVISAVVYATMPVYGVTPPQVVEEILGKPTPSPPIPPQVQALIKCSTATSDYFSKEK